MKAACLAVVCVALCLGQQYGPWGGARFDKARARRAAPQEVYPNGAPSHPFVMDLTVVLVDGSNWTEARALRQVRRTANILGACGIALDEVRLARGRRPDGRHDIDMDELYPGSDLPADIVDFSRRVPPSDPWPRVFLVGRLLGQTTLARSYQRGDVSDEEAKRYPYMNTAWAAFRAHWEEMPEEGYSSLAHELAHVLCRCGHSGGEERHLLHEKRNFLGVRVLEQDCERMRRSPLVAPR